MQSDDTFDYDVLIAESIFCALLARFCLRSGFLDKGEAVVLVDVRLGELLLYLLLEDVQLFLHVPVDVSESLFWSVIVAVLALLARKGRSHGRVELFDFARQVILCLVLAPFFLHERARTFAPHLSQSLVLRLNLSFTRWLLVSFFAWVCL
jgi:hypothetical protein